MHYRVGVDFDNTIVSYDDVMYKVAVDAGLVSPETRRTKKNIRDCIRKLPNGEAAWQRIQAIIYGLRMDEARLMEGVQEFFSLCRTNQIDAYIVSHKTEFANVHGSGKNLKDAAMAWMRKNRFFQPDGCGLAESVVFFESTRREKIQRIKQLQCTHFIDDLEEIFLEESFPPHVVKILYNPHGHESSLTDVNSMTTWQAIGKLFL